MRQIAILFLAIMTLCSGAMAAMPGATCSRETSNHKVGLLELYTSEGCSSCPPADAIVSRLGELGLGADDVVALALHVDYWDSLGWRDRFASAVYTARQNWLSAVSDARVVYTPEFFLSGHELRIDRASQIVDAIRQFDRQPTTARIALASAPGPDGVPSWAVEALLPEQVAPRSAQLVLAFYEDGLSSQVAAGENEGRLLHHDRVVRRWVEAPAFGADGRLSWRWQEDAALRSHSGRTGVAAFIERRDSGEVLQAIALDSCAAPR